MTWFDHAACRGAPARIFYPGPLQQSASRPPRPEIYDTARSFCDRCPVRSDCLEDAMAVERTELARRRKEAA